MLGGTGTTSGGAPLAASRGGGTLARVTGTLVSGTSSVLTTGGVSVRGTIKGVDSAVLSHLVLGTSHVDDVTGNVLRIHSLPSGINGVLDARGLRGNLAVGGITIPFNIITVVCRDQPGIASSTTTLDFGDKGIYILENNGRTFGSTGTVIFTLGSTLGRYKVYRSCMGLVRSAAHRDTGRLVATINCISVLVPHNNGNLVRTYIRGTGIPYVRAKANVYRVFISGATSVGVTLGVVSGTGADHPSMYGTTRILLMSGNVTSRFLPGLCRVFGNEMRLHNSSTMYSVVPMGGSSSSSFSARFLSCVVTIGVISNMERTVSRVTGRSARRDRDVVAGSGRGTSCFALYISSTTICIGTSAHFASNNRFKLNYRVKVSARGLRTEKPVKLDRVGACGCVVGKGNRIEWRCIGWGI